MSLLRTQLIGNLGKDAEVRTIADGAMAISFAVAVTEKYTAQSGETKENTYWVNCTLWKTKNQSSRIADFLKKGIRVYVEGRPSAKAYASRDGEQKASLEVRVDKLELLTFADSSERPATAHTAPPLPIGGNDDLPF
jgi:single-strand DNA-binding protein